jgi:uncharacterized membrane protein YeaQ/YmgE (transglycosylase-associated protein family)
MGIISWIIWGLFVGLLARLVLPGRQPIGFIWTVALGIAGSLVGGFVATEILHIADNDEFDFGSFLIAIATSALLLWAYLRYFADRGRAAHYGSADR